MVGSGSKTNNFGSTTPDLNGNGKVPVLIRFDGDGSIF
jgi:hypothetical protein